MGRPTDFNPELADRICAEVAQGISLRTICKADDMPCASVVFKWLRLHSSFVEQYARAKSEAADAMAEEILDIADDGTNDWMARLGSDGEPAGWQLNGEHVQRSKLRVDSRKWLASKLKPKKYGDQWRGEISGPEGGPIETTNVLSGLSTDDLLTLRSIASKTAGPRTDR